MVQLAHATPTYKFLIYLGIFGLMFFIKSRIEPGSTENSINYIQVIGWHAPFYRMTRLNTIIRTCIQSGG